MREAWQAEKAVVAQIQEGKKAIEGFKLEAKQAERDGDYGRVAELRYGKIRQTEEKINALQQSLRDRHDGKALIK